jgi:enterochelin esterase-like enzyme
VLYDTPVRGPKTQASILVYLPPGYKTDVTRRFPVLYWLHGGGQDQHAGAPVVARIDAKIRAGEIPPFIVVLPQALPDVRYINSKDGTIPLEDVLMKDLIPYVDAKYRTIARREARAIEGFSMGGFGALRLGFKFPQVFGVVSALAPSITNYRDEPACIVAAFGDQDYYDRVGPWEMARQNAAAIRESSAVRLLVGDQDRLLPLVQKYDGLLTELKIEHQFSVSGPDVDHRVEPILDRAPADALMFWGSVFGNLRY